VTPLSVLYQDLRQGQELYLGTPSSTPSTATVTTTNGGISGFSFVSGLSLPAHIFLLRR
jgi:hypothetical protein